MFVLSAMWSDLVNWTAFSIGPLNVFPIDFLTIAASVFLLRKPFQFTPRQSRRLLLPLFLFLVWLLFEVLHGIPAYSFSAFGDARLIVPFFFSLVSFKLWMSPKKLEMIGGTFEKLLLVSACAVILMFFLELVAGHRVGIFFMNSEEEAFGELIDARGVRLLGSDQTFAAGVFFTFLFISTLLNGWVGSRKAALAVFLVVIVIMSQNRTSAVSLAFGLSVYAAFIAGSGKRVKAIVFLLASFTVAFVVILIVSPDLIASIRQLLLAGLDPEQDPTGTWGWRLELAASAIDQFAQNPMVGQGYGGHWNLLFGQELVTAPPHNQYLSLLVKCGLVGVLLFLGVMVAAIYSYFRHRSAIPPRLRALFDTLFVVILASIPYGFAYDYVPTFGFYLGAFYGIIARVKFFHDSNKSELDPDLLSPSSDIKREINVD